jgi:release factor glutamine methyltransferase
MSRLEQGEPLPYVIGHSEFYGLDFYLSHDVLIPRPETELLVERGISWLRNHPGQRKAIDVGTGSGCIGIALAMNIPDLNILITDISPDALKVARINIEKFCLAERIEFKQANLLEGIVGQYNLICANLPYISSQVLQELPVAGQEPWIALNGGEKGTELISRMLDQARGCISPDGLILLEIESSQGNEVKTLAKMIYPACEVEILKDLAGLDRCIALTTSNQLVHICKNLEWQQAQVQGNYTSKSLIQEGFIHCSQPHQILQVASRFYQRVPGLVLLWIDPEKILAEIRWEFSDGALFPHIYGPINLDAVISVTDFSPDEDGIFRVDKLNK